MEIQARSEWVLAILDCIWFRGLLWLSGGLLWMGSLQEFWGKSPQHNSPPPPFGREILKQDLP